MCFSLLELSILNLLHKASKLIPEPGNLFLANSSVSIIFELLHSIIPNRAFELNDLFANSLGVIFAFFIFKIIKKFKN